jgi:hypothetical protein
MTAAQAAAAAKATRMKRVWYLPLARLPVFKGDFTTTSLFLFWLPDPVARICR